MSIFIQDDDIPPSFLPVTHDSMRLIEQTKTICEQRIYLDEAKELFSLISSKWLQVRTSKQCSLFKSSVVLSKMAPLCSYQAVLEIHDEVAAQIENYTEEVEYIDGVSSIDDDETRSRLSSVTEGREGEDKGAGAEDEEEVKVDTFRVIGVRRLPGECLVRTSSRPFACGFGLGRELASLWNFIRRGLCGRAGREEQGWLSPLRTNEEHIPCQEKVAARISKKGKEEDESPHSSRTTL